MLGYELYCSADKCRAFLYYELNFCPGMLRQQHLFNISDALASFFHYEIQVLEASQWLSCEKIGQQTAFVKKVYIRGILEKEIGSARIKEKPL